MRADGLTEDMTGSTKVFLFANMQKHKKRQQKHLNLLFNLNDLIKIKLNYPY